MLRWLALLAVLTALPAGAETLVAAQTIRPQEILTESHIKTAAGTVPGAHTDPAAVVGQEARFAIYPGRPIMRSAIGAPALVSRNQLVEIVFSRGGLSITAEGRALGRAGAGDRVRVMNLQSKAILFGTVTAHGTVTVER